MNSTAKAEQHENVCRKNFTPSEAVAMKQQIEGIERERAKARQREGQRVGGETAGRGRPQKHPANLAGSNNGESRDKVAAAVGMKRTSLEKAEQVVASGDEKLIDMMNSTAAPVHCHGHGDYAPPPGPHGNGQSPHSRAYFPHIRQ